MARSYARITTSIWRDDDFLALSPSQQALYFMLVTQPDITAAGTLALTTRRWAKGSIGWSARLVEQELAALADRGHVVVDEDTEELLVRTFIKWDGGWNNTKRIPVIRDAALAIASPILRAQVAVEIGRLGLSDIASLLARDRASDRQSTSERVGVALGDHISNPQPATPEREPFAADAGEPPSMFCSKHPAGTTDPCGPCGTARRIFDAWHAADAQRAEREKAEAKDRLRNCTRCNAAGWVEDFAGNLIERCDHLVSIGESA